MNWGLMVLRLQPVVNTLIEVAVAVIVLVPGVVAYKRLAPVNDLEVEVFE